jgi:uncharacterized membrane protein YccC
MKSWPGIAEWVFAFKTFAAAMLALYVAFSIGLERPYWAMAGVYIVSQPLAGSLRSKAIYRLLGTAIGAAATIVFVPNLVNSPELLCLGMALWIGLCVYLGLLDRTPRAYVFLLAGYTAAFVGFPSVTTPDQIWDIALARVEEIWLGIGCATVVGTVVFPRELGPLLSARILGWVANASAWAEEVLGSACTDATTRAGRIRLAADAVELRMLASQLSYDTSIMQRATRWVEELQRRMVMLLPLLSSISDRLGALRAAGGVTPGLEALLADMQVWVRAGAPPPRCEADRLRAAITRLEQETDPRAGWNEVMRASLLLRLRELVDVRQDMRDLRWHIERGATRLHDPLAVETGGPVLRHHDHGFALFSGFAAGLTLLLLSLFWIETGWQAAGSGVAIAGAACTLFASLDDPTPAITKFMIAAIIAVGAVGIGLFGILPRVHDFEILALALAAFFVPAGVLMAIPATQPIGTAVAFITATLLSLQSTYAADFISYADGGLAAILGLAGAAAITAVVRSVGAEWSARRLVRAIWRQLAEIPHFLAPHERTVFAGLLIDRLGLLVPRLASVGKGNDLAAVDALADLRVGINMVDLQRDREAMPRRVRGAVDDVLFGIASHYAAQAAVGHVRKPAAELLRDIDRATDGAVAVQSANARDVLLQLVGLRRGLFPNAAPYAPGPTPPDDAAEVSAVRQAA